MLVTIYTAKSKLFDKVQSKSVYLPSTSGDMQILDNHIPVIVVLKAGEVILEKSDGDKIKIRIDAGYVQFSNNELIAVIEKMSLTESERNILEKQAEEMRYTEVKHEDSVSESEFEDRNKSERN